MKSSVVFSCSSRISFVVGTVASLRLTLLLSLTVSVFCCDITAYADRFGSGLNSFDIEFVEIGNPGNQADDISIGINDDPIFAGSVAQSYRIGKFEISRDMIIKANAEGGIGITLADMSSQGGNEADKPATGVTWFEAAQFVNWLNTSKGAAAAYKFDGAGNFQLWQPDDAGYDPNNLYRNSLTTYFLPSTDEWHKAAYYNSVTDSYGEYPTANGLIPTPISSGTAANTAVHSQLIAAGPAEITLAGGLSPYGTMGQGGNVWEWEESDYDLVNDSSLSARSNSSARGLRGGSYNSTPGYLSAPLRGSLLPDGAFSDIGFRVATVPEPSTFALACMALLGGLFVWRVRVPR